jgi:hypothetical protein
MALMNRCNVLLRLLLANFGIRNFTCTYERIITNKISHTIQFTFHYMTHARNIRYLHICYLVPSSTYPICEKYRFITVDTLHSFSQLVRAHRRQVAPMLGSQYSIQRLQRLQNLFISGAPIH